MKHIAVITEKPERSGKYSVPDGALNGNGDVGIILGNSGNGLRIYISKCDIWQGIERFDRGGLKPLGYIDVDIPDELYENYYVEQDMDNGELHCVFRKEDKSCELYIRACKTENSVMLEAVGNIGVKPVLKVFGGETSGEKGECVENDCPMIYRIFRGEDHAYETHAYACMKSLGDKFYTFIATTHDVDDPRAECLTRASEITAEKYETLKRGHYAAWKSFWSKSSFTVDDAELELGWYASQYLLAGCTGNEKFPPGLYANFVTVENPSWHSDYHLNYNYQAPFYAACSSNHVEFTDCYHAPLEEFAEKGRSFAERYGCRGILLPVGIAPKGLCSELDVDSKFSFERLFLGQKSNALHPADIMVFRWNATRDKTYARDHAYPYLKACLEFFEDHMTLENGRYSVGRDAAHEVPYYKKDFDPRKYKRYINDKNNSLTLGMLRLCLPAAVEMAKALGVDGDKQKKWQDMYDRLSPFATCRRRFRKVYRYTEKGQRWNNGGDVGLQHIYPGGCIGSESDAKALKLARNTFRQKKGYCYIDDNAVSSFFPMAARLGEAPDGIIKKLRELNEKKLLPNMLYAFAGGCLENCPIFANTLNEMVLQSFEGTVKLFPNWDKSIDCRFSRLRADGAFLISAEMKSGAVTFVEIESEAGETLKMKNPFKTAKISSDGRLFTVSDREIVIETDGVKLIRIEEN